MLQLNCFTACAAVLGPLLLSVLGLRSRVVLVSNTNIFLPSRYLIYFLDTGANAGCVDLRAFTRIRVNMDSNIPPLPRHASDGISYWELSRLYNLFNRFQMNQI